MSEQIKNKIAELNAALETGDPTIAGNILWIHKQLLETPEAVHILSEDEIATIIKGQEVTSGNMIISPPKKNKVAKYSEHEL